MRFYQHLFKIVLLIFFSIFGWSCIDEPAHLYRDAVENDLPSGHMEGGDDHPDEIPSNQGTAQEMLGGMLAGSARAGVEIQAGIQAGISSSENGGLELAGNMGGFTELDLPVPPSAEESCDGLDNDLDGLIDEEVSNACGGCTNLNEDQALNCFSWGIQAIHTREEESITPLDPSKIFNLAGVLSQEREFNVTPMNTSDQATCKVLTLESVIIPSLGQTWFESPQTNLIFSFNPRTGRYEPEQSLAEQTAIITHQSTDRVEIGWEGFPERQGWGSFEEGVFYLQSPEPPRPSTGMILEPILDRFMGRMPLDEAVDLRWDPQGISAAPSALPAQELKLYVGGSRSITQRGNYREIHHFQLGLSLADDGYFQLPQELSGSHPGSGIWVYLERIERDWLDRGLHSISAQIGHRIELRESASGAPVDWETPIRLLAPAEDLEAISLDEGLFVSWEPVGENAYESLTISLVRQGPERLISLSCDLDARARVIRIPAEELSYWPESDDSLRLLTLRANLKSVSRQGADRGRYTEGVSLLQYLPPRLP